MRIRRAAGRQTLSWHASTSLRSSTVCALDPRINCMPQRWTSTNNPAPIFKEPPFPSTSSSWVSAKSVGHPKARIERTIRTKKNQTTSEVCFSAACAFAPIIVFFMQLGWYHNHDARPSADQSEGWHCPNCRDLFFEEQREAFGINGQRAKCGWSNGSQLIRDPRGKDDQIQP
jgi:hypothetical protein